MADVDALVREVREGLAQAADPSRAPGQQAYMRTEEPFLGVPVPVLRRTVREVLKAAGALTHDEWRSAVLALWDAAACREHRYAALAVLRAPQARGWRDASSLPLVRHLVVTGAWWDLVDDAAHVLRDALDAEPGPVARELRGWARDDDVWVRRAAVISQLGRKGATDLDLLAACLDAQLGRPEFWLRKACGWALRDLSYADPAWVRAYLAAHTDELSPLTRREAVKAMDRVSQPRA